jgi:hypothetical protein
LTWKKKGNVSEEKSEFESSWSESLGFKCGTPIMLDLRTITYAKIWTYVIFK